MRKTVSSDFVQIVVALCIDYDRSPSRPVPQRRAELSRIAGNDRRAGRKHIRDQSAAHRRQLITPELGLMHGDSAYQASTVTRDASGMGEGRRKHERPAR